MDTTIVIPARWGSTRFPGKPLHEIRGRSLLERVWQVARATDAAARVIIATDDSRIVEHAATFGAEAVMTSEECRNGTERVAEVCTLLGLSDGVVVNLQGDAVLTPPWVLTAVIQVFADPQVEVATPAVRLTLAQYEELVAQKAQGQSRGTCVVCDARGRALYFSKQIIPYLRRTVREDPLPILRHIGLYAYRVPALQRWIELPEGVLEKCEGLEQLRALEFGLPIQVAEVDYRGRTHWSVDTPEDAVYVEQLLDREGELVP